MKPNYGSHELADDEYAIGKWTNLKGNSLLVVDYYFRGLVFEIDVQILEIAQWPSLYLNDTRIGKIIKYILFLIAYLTTNVFSVECFPALAYAVHLFTPYNSFKTKFVILSLFNTLVISQYPKFVFWRNRPWRLGVGKVFRRD